MAFGSSPGKERRSSLLRKPSRTDHQRRGAGLDQSFRFCGWTEGLSGRARKHRKCGQAGCVHPGNEVIEDGEIVRVFAKECHVEVRGWTAGETDECTSAKHRLGPIDVAEEHRQITPRPRPNAGVVGVHQAYI